MENQANLPNPPGTATPPTIGHVGEPGEMCPETCPTCIAAENKSRAEAGTATPREPLPSLMDLRGSVAPGTVKSWNDEESEDPET